MEMAGKRTPETFTNEIVAEIKRRGFPDTDAPEAQDTYSFPREDITKLSLRKLGKVQGYWAAWLGYGIKQLSLSDTALAYIESEYNKIYKKWFFKLDPGDKSELKDSIESRVLDVEEVAEWGEWLVKEQALNTMLRGKVEEAKAYLASISREQTRRKEEWERTH